jgi:predicted ATPase
MLEVLQIENFKAFRRLDVALRPLTLLAGVNGVGKSTVIQSLLLLRQSYASWPRLAGSVVEAYLHESSRELFPLVPNGTLMQLGNISDILNRSAEQSVISIGVLDSSNEIGLIPFRFLPMSGTENFLLDTQELAFLTAPGLFLELAEAFSIFQPEFQYLQAERLGPRTTFDADLQGRALLGNLLGSRGEYTAHFLNYWSGRSVAEPLVVQEVLKHPTSDSSTLNAQVMAWMGEISPETKLETQPIEDTDLVRLRFGFGDSDYFRPINVGFGLTYTLPIVTALVAAQPNALILLENPEAHLHPRGQLKVGELIARAVGAGVQVILETHSDHILNAIRLAVKRQDVPLRHDQVQICFFQRPNRSAPVEMITPQLDADGRFDEWPAGFFDEFGNVLLDLL